MELNDRGFARVSKFGGGSSFDKRRFDGRNQIMDVFNGRDFLNDSERETLEIILDDREHVELAKSVEALN